MSELKGVRKSYEIGKTIGEGSFAVVKAGRHIETGTPVAIKIVSKRDALFNEESLDREIATMMQCDHPNCVALYQVNVWLVPRFLIKFCRCLTSLKTPISS